MHNGTPAEWVSRLRQEGEVWNIGQLDKPTMKALDQIVRNGEAAKTKELWCYLLPKTVWRLTAAPTKE